MPRLINADKLKDIISDTWILDRIDEQPAVDAEPVRHGKWLKIRQSFVNPNKFRNYFCSECGLELDEHIRSKPNYCPNCGAKMDEVI